MFKVNIWIFYSCAANLEMENEMKIRTRLVLKDKYFPLLLVAARFLLSINLKNPLFLYIYAPGFIL